MDAAVRTGETTDRAPGPHRIVVVGGGAGGLELVTRPTADKAMHGSVAHKRCQHW